MPNKFATALATSALIALAGAAPASADTVNSSNWAGYAVHRSGVSFTKVVGAWRAPRAKCTAGHRTYSAVWIGLGGYSVTSTSLEQIGTEEDCNASGRAVSSAWYELVPAASRAIHLRVRPGDAMSASVTVTGNQVRLALSDATRHKSFRRTLSASAIDVSSAEWIVEAPSDCVSATVCQTLPLADFGSTTFTLASAQAATGHIGSIADPDWGATKIRLTPRGRRFVTYNGSGAAAGAASPSTLSAGGSSFKVKYASVQGSPSFSQRRAAVRAGQLVHSGRW